MPDLLLRFKKNKDGSAALTCVRSDGSSTWQRQEGKLGSFFPPHDLTHFSVETALGYSSAFYGLVADGWELSDFTHPWPRGRPPVEAHLVEVIVSSFEMEQRIGAAASAQEFNDRTLERLEAKSDDPRTPPQRILSDEELDRVRSLRARLLERWSALPPGETLELVFDRARIG